MSRVAFARAKVAPAGRSGGKLDPWKSVVAQLAVTLPMKVGRSLIDESLPFDRTPARPISL